jgi:hypothetical protein
MSADRPTRFSITPEVLARLPTLADLGVRLEILEAAEEIADASDVIGLERTRLDRMLRIVFALDRGLLPA